MMTSLSNSTTTALRTKSGVDSENHGSIGLVLACLGGFVEVRFENRRSLQPPSHLDFTSVHQDHLEETPASGCSNQRAMKHLIPVKDVRISTIHLALVGYECGKGWDTGVVKVGGGFDERGGQCDRYWGKEQSGVEVQMKCLTKLLRGGVRCS
ncbi:hypothetical protein QQ045_010447 [Rhodiola kirilowii]